ncbi:hypothetical protein DERP_009578 [Dermatophagoides pteronyssinus]|uniref:Uncharacterized protein n=1 Tax=Dermatophagoides pteronyssinus TaxID=6956 RepID=A0ABQ8JA90_DERPT|nr:hypothetical protein DERP_009578 [Dermatophagoides pteronyssinus]
MYAYLSVHCIRKIFNVYHVHIDNYEIEKYQIDSVFNDYTSSSSSSIESMCGLIGKFEAKSI